jgi:hypothetical protein
MRPIAERGSRKRLMKMAVAKSAYTSMATPDFAPCQQTIPRVGMVSSVVAPDGDPKGCDRQHSASRDEKRYFFVGKSKVN